MTSAEHCASSNNRKRRPRLTIVCENYWPEVASTAQLITELAEGMVEHFEVEVLCAQPKYHADYSRRAWRERRNGVSVRRLPATTFSKNSALGRLSNWLTFTLSLALALLARWSRRTYLFVTNPPTAPWLAPLAKLQRQRAIVLVYDLYPDLAEAIGAVRAGGLAARVFDAANRFSLRQADVLIAPGADMRTRLRHKLGGKQPVTVLPNWADGSLIRPATKENSQFARRNGLLTRPVFLYAGNLGLFQDLETLVQAVNSLPRGEYEDPVLVFVGNGGKRQAVEAAAANSTRVRVYDYVPYDMLGDLYAACDVGLIALEPGVNHANAPSKTYSILAAGKPFLAVCQANSDLEELASEGCGVCVPNDGEAVATAMRQFLEDPERRLRMGATARRIFEERFERALVLDRYRRLLLSGRDVG